MTAAVAPRAGLRRTRETRRQVQGGPYVSSWGCGGCRVSGVRSFCPDRRLNVRGDPEVQRNGWASFCFTMPYGWALRRRCRLLRFQNANRAREGRARLAGRRVCRRRILHCASGITPGGATANSQKPTTNSQAVQLSSCVAFHSDMNTEAVGSMSAFVWSIQTGQFTRNPTISAKGCFFSRVSRFAWCSFCTLADRSARHFLTRC
jgi:hypothetical protein